jgi:putative ABC transport system substrate-binding protein
VKRREFITLVGGAAAWPLGAHAQQPVKPAIAFLRSASLTDASHLVAAFSQGLKEAGFVEGRNVEVEYHSAEGQRDQLPALAAELVRRKPDAIITSGGSFPALAMKAATATIPIVCIIGDDPVKNGLVASLSRPGGNVTGITLLTADMGSKRLGLLRELVPTAKLIAVLANPGGPDFAPHWADVEAAARVLGQDIKLVPVTSEASFEDAFATIVQSRAGALIVSSDPYLTSKRKLLIALATRYKVPALYEFREHAVEGGLAGYGPSHTEPYRLAGLYAARILKGDKPADLPFMQSTKFEFVINLKAAKSLGLEVPPMLSARADEVIE